MGISWGWAIAIAGKPAPTGFGMHRSTVGAGLAGERASNQRWAVLVSQAGILNTQNEPP
ncbi:hypothetical protein D3C76_1789980 [compost metagenome]